MPKPQHKPPIQTWKAPQRDAVLKLVLAGMRTKDIAERLGINYYTAKDHVKRLYKIYGVHSRAGLFEQHGVVLRRPTRPGRGKDKRLTPLREAPGPLAERRQAVACLLVLGLPYSKIESILGVRHEALLSDVTSIYRVFGVHSRAELAAKLIVPAPGTKRRRRSKARS